MGSSLINSVPRLLEEILDFVRTENDKLFLVLMFTKDRRVTQIDSYHRRIAALVQEFQVSAAIARHSNFCNNIHIYIYNSRYHL